jgi:hypothetical protein
LKYPIKFVVGCLFPATQTVKVGVHTYKIMNLFRRKTVFSKQESHIFHVLKLVALLLKPYFVDRHIYLVNANLGLVVGLVAVLVVLVVALVVLVVTQYLREK